MPVLVCQLCYGKAKISLDFILKIKESQKNLKTFRIPSSTVTSSQVQQSLPESVLKKMKGKSGLSIRRVTGASKSKPSEPFVQEINVADLLSNVEVKIEKEDESLLNEFVMDGFKSDPEESPEEGDDDADSDYDFSPKSMYPIASTSARSNGGDYFDVPISFNCATCKISFPSLEVLSEHMKTCYRAVRMKCDICLKVFETRKKLTHHKANFHKPKVVTTVLCEHCAKPFNTQFDLNTHIEAVHKRVIRNDCIYRCNQCNDTFHSHLDLMEHMVTHKKRIRKKVSRECEICHKLCPDRTSYMRHMYNHNSKNETVTSAGQSSSV